MRTIYKYQLEIAKEQKLSLPIAAEIKSIQAQDNRPFIWAEVETNITVERSRTIFLFETGKDIGDTRNMRYLGTIQLLNGSYVLHAYEQII